MAERQLKLEELEKKRAAAAAEAEDGAEPAVIEDDTIPEDEPEMEEEVKKEREETEKVQALEQWRDCLLYTSPSPRDRQKSRMPSSA